LQILFIIDSFIQAIKNNAMINFKKPAIFIVEDDPAFSKLIEKTLRASGYTNLKIYPSGDKCIDDIQNTKPDIIIQDFAMPGINGLETMKKIRKVYPDTEFLFLSGQSSIKIAIETIKQGAFDYIVKDEVAQQNVVQKIKKILYIHKLRHEKKMSVYGKWLFLIILIASWAIFALLWYLGLLKEVIM
jgi:DNA-binding NtrC family response regulator